MSLRLELSRALSTSEIFPVPEGKRYFPFQEAGIEYALSGRHTLFADEPGLGKTIQAIGFCNVRKPNGILVLCPASLVGNWKKEFESWSTHQLKIEIFKPGKRNRYGPQPDVLIFSYGYASSVKTVAQLLAGYTYECCIADEVHVLKNPKAIRTKNVLARNGIASRAMHVLAISGTPIQNRPMDIYPIIKFLAPAAIENADYFAFGMKYCAGWKSQWGWDFSGASNLPDLGKRLRSCLMVRREKKDVLKDLPEKLPPNLVYLDRSKETDQIVKRMATFDADTALKGGVSAAFDELSELRREIGIGKIEAAVDYIKTQLDSGHKKILVFAHHKEVLEGLRTGLADFNPAMIVGDTPTDRRSIQVERFQTEKDCRVFLGSIAAAGVGLTLTAGSYVIFVEFSWTPSDNDQATDRAHRIGQHDCVQTDYLVHEGSLDERILKVILKKTKVIDEVLA